MTTPIKPSNQSPVDEFVAECQKTFERYVSHAHAASSESGFVQQAADRIPVDNWFLDSVEQALSRDASHESKYRFREKVLFDYVYRAISNERAPIPYTDSLARTSIEAYVLSRLTPPESQLAIVDWLNTSDKERVQTN
jgi:hypothetical protein